MEDTMKHKLVVGAALCAATVTGIGTSVLAGEVTGSGKGGPNGDGVPGGIGRARSECVFSGLEDFDGLAPVSPGTVQNWGHVANDPFITVVDAPKGASEVTVILNFPPPPAGPGPIGPITIGCNPHAGGGE
jgi:hypothetical protein